MRNETRVERKWERVGADRRTRWAEGRSCGSREEEGGRLLAVTGGAVRRNRGESASERRGTGGTAL